jgi:hypothetical protein
VDLQRTSAARRFDGFAIWLPVLGLLAAGCGSSSMPRAPRGDPGVADEDQPMPDAANLRGFEGGPFVDDVDASEQDDPGLVDASLPADAATADGPANDAGANDGPGDLSATADALENDVAPPSPDAPAISPPDVAAADSAPAALLRISPPSYDFGSVPAGTSSGTPVVFTLTNVADAVAASIVVTPIGPDAEFFLEPDSQSNECRGKDLAPGASCTFKWTFIPSNPAAPPGLRTNVIDLRPLGGAADQHVTLRLTGTVGAAACVSGARRCMDTIPQTCDSQGRWQSGPACAGATPICTDGMCSPL